MSTNPVLLLVLATLIGSNLLRFIGATQIESRLKTLRREGRGLNIPNLFSPWEQLQAFWWIVSGEFRMVADTQVSRWGNIARIGAIGSLVGGAGIVLFLALSLVETVRNYPM